MNAAEPGSTNWWIAISTEAAVNGKSVYKLRFYLR
jgi:hypothetical protein